MRGGKGAALYCQVIARHIEMLSDKTKPHQTSEVGMRTGRAVAVIGELNVDLIASGLTSAPVLGREVLAEDFQTVLGSASAVFACGAARLGHPVSFFSKVGDDEYGRFCLDALQKLSLIHISPTVADNTGSPTSESKARRSKSMDRWWMPTTSAWAGHSV